MSYIYLASPYTDPSPLVMQERHDKAAEFTAMLLRNRQFVYSPIVHCHSLAEEFNLPRDFQFWQDYNFAMLEHASELYILTLPGWEDSAGVAAERHFAASKGIPEQLYSEALTGRKSQQ